jgi:PIN domain nuclease of toxin-antitoxin system
VRWLLDTQVLLWAAGEPERLRPSARSLIEDREHDPHFSAASLWEVAIKGGLGRDDFRVDPRVLRRALLEHGYTELPITGAHAAAVDLLPPIHRDPFDRLLVAQSQIEAMTLLTADRTVADYPGSIQLI